MYDVPKPGDNAVFVDPTSILEISDLEDHRPPHLSQKDHRAFLPRFSPASIVHLVLQQWKRNDAQRRRGWGRGRVRREQRTFRSREGARGLVLG